MKIPNKANIKFEYNDEIREYVFDINELNNIIKEKQARIDKAIEYIEKYGKTIEEIAYQNGTCEDSLQEILDILKGNNSDEN